MAKGEECTEISDKSALIHAALRALVEREAARGWHASAAASLILSRFRDGGRNAGDRSIDRHP
jgi:hypothetical protein